MKTRFHCASSIVLLTVILLVCASPALTRAGEIYVSYNTGSVGVYSTSGATINASLIPSQGYDQFGLVVSGGNLFVDGGGVAEYDATSGAAINTGLVSLFDSGAMAISGDDLFVTSNISTVIEEYTTSGTTVNASLITLPATPDAVATYGNELFVATDYSAANRVGVYDATTGAVINFSFIAGLIGPVSLAISGQDLYVLSNHGTIGEYDANTGLPINASLVTGLYRPEALAVSGGNLFVASYISGVLGEYDATTGAAINAALITGLTDAAAIAVVTPEPATWLLFAIGAVGLLIRRRGRQR